MKNKFLIVFFVCTFLLVFFTACDIASDDDDCTYKIEVGVVSNSTYQTAWSQAEDYGSSITYANIKSIRDYLYENTSSNYDSTTGVTADEIYSFLVEKGFTSSQASAEVSAMERIGNDIAFFYYAYSSSYKVWMYAEKE